MGDPDSMVHFSLVGALCALVSYAISVAPSTLPRRRQWHGLVSGSLTGLGYVLGWGVEAGLRALADLLQVKITAPDPVFLWAKWIVVAAVVAGSLISIARSYRKSVLLARMQEMKPVGPGEYLVGLAVSTLMFAFVLSATYLLIKIFNLVVAGLTRWIWEPLAAAVALAVVVFVIYFVAHEVVLKGLMAVLARKAFALNTTSAHGYPQPQVPERSGAPASLVPWEQIGGQGRKFICKGPSAQMIEDVTGEPALEPIRIYAGMPRQNADLEAVADLAVADLERAGGFDRSVLLVNTATGSGWVDEWLVQPMEYLSRGDCAVVTMQYSYLFSAALLVSDLEVCAVAGELLFRKIKSDSKPYPPTGARC